MKIAFQYQRFYLRVGLCGLLVVIWIIVSQFIADKFTSSWLYWIVGAVVTIAIMSIFYKKTDNSLFFIKTGSFEKTDNGYIITIGKSYNFHDVKRLCAWKSNLYGTSLWFLQIEAEKKIKIMSKPLTNEQTFVSMDLYEIYKQIFEDNPELKQEKNSDGTVIPYFYSK